MRIIYMAHPVAGDVRANLARAKRWLRWATEAHPGIAIVSPWITECEIWDDADPAQRAAGLQRDLKVVERCDEVWLVGPRISSGMRMEADHAISLGIPVLDFTLAECVEPPLVGQPFARRRLEAS